MDDLNYLPCKIHFSCDGFQSYFIFHPLFNTLDLFYSNYVKVTVWKSAGISAINRLKVVLHLR